MNDIEAHMYPKRRAHCHAFKARHFTEYESCRLSQFIAFFIDQETKPSRALCKLTLFYSVKNIEVLCFYLLSVLCITL